MTLTLLKKQALKLPKAQRLKLASALLESVPIDEKPLTFAEIERRADEMLSGKVKGIPWDVAKARTDRLMAKIKRDRQGR